MVWKQKVLVLLPHMVVKKLDELTEKKGYGNRNETIRIAIMDLLKAEMDWGLE